MHRNVTELLHKCDDPGAIIARVRTLPNLTTHEELADFIAFCEGSQDKGLQGQYLLVNRA